MAKQNINVGTTANDKKGDSLRAAFQKVNTNFTELYAALGLDADTLNIGAFEFTGSTMSTTDSSAIVIDQAVTVSSNLTVGGDVLPSVANGGDLGSSARPWKSLYVSNNTIFIGGVPIGLDANGNLTVNGSLITGGGGSSVTTSATAPADPTLGDLWYDTESGRTYVYYDASWVDASPVDGVGITSYTDLTNKPTLFSGSYADLTNKPNLGGTYQFSVAADDSTQRLISTDEVIKFIGAGGITTASDAEGNITINYVQGDIRSDSNINIDINLADSTLRRWSFGEDGDLTFPDASVQSTAYVAASWPVTNTAGSYGPTQIAIGRDAGYTGQGDNAVAIGQGAGLISQGNSAVAIGYGAGNSNQGASAVAIGQGAGLNTQAANSIIINATGSNLNQTVANTFTVAPIRSAAATSNVLYYNTTTKEVSYGTTTSVSSLVNGAHTVSLDAAGALTLPGDIRSEGNINIDINLSDSTLRRWQFGEDGNLTLGGIVFNGSTTTNISGSNIDGTYQVFYSAGEHWFQGPINRGNFVWVDVLADLDGVGTAGHIRSGQGQNLIIDGGYENPSGAGGNLYLRGRQIEIRANVGGAGIQSKNWVFTDDGSLTIPGDIRSEGNINIEVNLGDSTLRRWSFGEDGDLTFPDGTSQSTAGGSWPVTNTAGASGPAEIAIGRYAGYTTQGNYAVAVGLYAGTTTQGTSSVAIGYAAGYLTQGEASVAVGRGAGETTQGQSAVAIGVYAGQTSQAANTIILNASGVAVNGVAAQTNSFYVAPIRNIGGTSGVLQYNATTKEVTYSSDITSEGNINIEINLSDSTKRIWQFGEDGNLTFPDGTSQSTAGGSWPVTNTAGASGPTQIAIGRYAGYSTQGNYGVAVGLYAGQSKQGNSAAAIGEYSGTDNQGNYAVAIGRSAGYTDQGANAVAIGQEAGYTGQGANAVAIGQEAGLTSQGNYGVAIGLQAGRTNQGLYAVAIGETAGTNAQGLYGVAVGETAGSTTQGYSAVAVGTSAGYYQQGAEAVAIGPIAGYIGQGANAVAIGCKAGETNQAANSIIINATGSTVDGVAAQTNSFYVAPVRNASGTSGVLQYNATTKEVTYSSDITSEGNINIEINLSDSTKRIWQFGEDGLLTFPDATVQTTAYQTSIVRAQRAAGGTEFTTDKWTFTTVTGAVTAEWVVDGSAAYPALGLASSPYIIFTFTGFTHLPSTLYRNGIVGSGTGIYLVNLAVETVTRTNSPNVLTAFNPTLHKYAFVEGSSLVEDRYYEFRI